MGGRFRSFDRNEELIRAISPNPGSAFRTQPERFSKFAFTIKHHFKGAEHRIGVSEFEIKTVGLFCSKNAMLKAFHGKCNSRACSNRIHAVFITEMVGPRDRG